MLAADFPMVSAAVMNGMTLGRWSLALFPVIASGQAWNLPMWQCLLMFSVLFPQSDFDRFVDWDTKGDGLLQLVRIKS